MVQNSEYLFLAIRYIKLYSEIISSMRPSCVGVYEWPLVAYSVTIL